jgi:nitroreductase
MRIRILFLSLFFVIAVSGQINTIDSTKIKKCVPAKDDNIWDVFQYRRSVRKFKPDSVPEKDILKIIDAARMAPSSGNQQPWKFLIIRDKNKILAIKEACIKSAAEFYDSHKDIKKTKEQFMENAKNKFEEYCSAPVYIVVLTDNNSKYPKYNYLDGSSAAGYLMLAARALGYGTVFITDAISEQVTKDVLRIPDDYTRICITPIGVPYEWPETPPKKSVDEFIIREKF